MLINMIFIFNPVENQARRLEIFVSYNIMIVSMYRRLLDDIVVKY